MKRYTIIKISASWSMSSLIRKVEEVLNKKTLEGYEIVSVSFGVNMWWMPTAFITLHRKDLM
ncbi:hypothetical protein [uncultured Acetobacteroides sp.]|uniref:hypothetical protein n=1 Tax=uncultured Acetobacteroides sp. TaxID=1760811 RepID=UPI0029F495D5|nr:hypothetical protein [uncultured Acetobacteroides sp.]